MLPFHPLSGLLFVFLFGGVFCAVVYLQDHSQLTLESTYDFKLSGTRPQS